MSHGRSYRDRSHRRPIGVAAGVAAIALLATAGPAGATSGTVDEAAPADSTLVMPGGQEGTVFRSLTVEGEDRIRVEFERPMLELQLDPRSAPGLEWGDTREILDRTELALGEPYLERSRSDRTPYLARPWLDRFASSPVARFHPDIEDVASWRLSIANSRGQEVASFSGIGKPPREIGWDGRAESGTPVPPGLVYSYALEASDRAGNHRTFVGEGFQLPPYVHESTEAVTFLFSAEEIDVAGQSGVGSGGPIVAPILADVISRLNQLEGTEGPVRVEVTARSFDQARSIADGITSLFSTRLLSDPARLQPLTRVEPDAPASATVAVVAIR